jgi:hypothetical protein
VGIYAFLPINKWYLNFKGISGHNDYENGLLGLYFVEGPLLFFCGGFFGNFIFKKYLRRKRPQ